MRGFVGMKPTPDKRVHKFPVIVLRIPPPLPGESLNDLGRWPSLAEIVEVDGVPQPAAFKKTTAKGCTFEEFLCVPRTGLLAAGRCSRPV